MPSPPSPSRSAWLDLGTWREIICRAPRHGTSVLRLARYSTHDTGALCALGIPWRVACIASLCLFIGCATAYTPPPLTTQHPTHPEAVAAPAQPPSQTLVYNPADRPIPQPAMSLAHESGQGAHASGHGKQPKVVTEGTVIAVVPGSQQLVVAHQDIPGVMGAMTMGYRVEPSSLLEGVKPGDTIRFTMDTQQQTIIRLEKLDR